MASCNPCGNKKIYIADIADATDMGPGANVPSGVYRADAGGSRAGRPAGRAVRPHGQSGLPPLATCRDRPGTSTLNRWTSPVGG